MTPTAFPTVAAPALPTASLRAPIPVRMAENAPPEPVIPTDAAPDDHELTQRISAEISRAVRQRRYTR